MFVHLDCHSHYSFLRAVPSPEEIIAATIEASMPAVAPADTNGMYAAIPFYKAAPERGIKPIVGVKLDVECGEKADFSPVKISPGRDERSRKSAPVVLLAENEEGYRNLCLLTWANA